MTRDHFMKDDYVMRRVEVCGVPDIWYGYVLGWQHTKGGRLVIVVESVDFTFVSDPFHLEKVHDPLQSPRKRQDFSAPR